MIITLTGSSGLIGTRLKKRLEMRGHSVRILTFKGSNNQNIEKDFSWDPENKKIDPKALKGIDVAIHLAGTSIAQRWTPKTKTSIARSRSMGSQLLVDTLQNLNPEARIVSASGIGYYPDPCTDVIDEHHSMGHGFLSQVCQEWEAPFMPSLEAGKSVHIMRTGLVLSNQAGVLPLVQSVASWGIIPLTGSSNNTWSWIHIEDLVSLYLAAAEQTIDPGIYNAVAPMSCSQGELADELLALKNNTPWKWKPCLPPFLLKAVLGEQSCLALTDQTVVPRALEKQPFSFEFPSIQQALTHLNAHHEL
jgi:uncharacterized protein (TIGR01777 family)